MLNHICKNPEEIRDLFKYGKSPEPTDPKNANLLFWKFFCEEKDFAILKVVKNYFLAVQNVFNTDWKSDSSPLCRTIGYGALMKLLEPLARKGLSQVPQTLEQAFFERHLRKASNLAPFTFEKYSPSGGGETAIYKDLYAAIFEGES